MEKYVALLRGINVSGQKKIKMAELRSMLTNAGFDSVQTYIQSGNIVVSSQLSPDKIANKIEQCILKNYDFHVPTLVLSKKEITDILQNNPFSLLKGYDVSKTYYCLLYTPPTKEGIENLTQLTYTGEKLFLHENVAYLQFENGAGRAKLNNNLIERKLGVTASSRNFNTIKKLLELCS